MAGSARARVENRQGSGLRVHSQSPCDRATATAAAQPLSTEHTRARPKTCPSSRAWSGSCSRRRVSPFSPLRSAAQLVRGQLVRGLMLAAAAAMPQIWGSAPIVGRAAATALRPACWSAHHASAASSSRGAVAAAAARSTLACHSLRGSAGVLVPSALHLRSFSSPAEAEFEQLSDAVRRMLSLDNASQVLALHAVFSPALHATSPRESAGRARALPVVHSARVCSPGGLFLALVSSAGSAGSHLLFLLSQTRLLLDGKEQARHPAGDCAVPASPRRHGITGGADRDPFRAHQVHDQPRAGAEVAHARLSWNSSRKMLTHAYVT